MQEKKVQQNLYVSKGNTLFVDISEVYYQDHKTGIQRVVRSVMQEMQSMTDMKYTIVPVVVTDQDGYWDCRLADNPELRPVPKGTDIFFGLDLSGRVTHAYQNGLFNEWNQIGVKFYFVIYDILPLYHPQWWPDLTYDHHHAWFVNVLSMSDKLICISQSVQNSVRQWIKDNNPKVKPGQTIDWFHLGSDIKNSQPSKGLPDNYQDVLAQLDSSKSFLMVGTIEPRKGHRQAFEAFKELWAAGHDYTLVIVGKEGWLVEDLVSEMREFQQTSNKLVLLQGISDEYLEAIYEHSNCLLIPSEGEGFGLPIFEASYYEMPIIARDIEVFREVAGEHAFYFDNVKDPSALSKCILEWAAGNDKGTTPDSKLIKSLTWKESTNVLTTKLGLK